jgi:hypothetical protein
MEASTDREEVADAAAAPPPPPPLLPSPPPSLIPFVAAASSGNAVRAMSAAAAARALTCTLGNQNGVVSFKSSAGNTAVKKMLPTAPAASSLAAASAIV